MGRGGRERAWSRAAIGPAAGVLALAAASCALPPRMCVSGGDCGTSSSCVAGRCVARGAVVAVIGARRLVYDPVQVGYVHRGGPGGPDESAAPAVAALGGSGVAFLRFEVQLPPEAEVLEAYVLLDRAAGVDAAVEPVTLHLAPVVDVWDARSLSWATQPRVEEVGAPVTRVLPSASGPIRLDVRSIVERWRRADRSRESGVAVLGERGREGTDALFALGPSGLGASGPRLEVYVR